MIQPSNYANGFFGVDNPGNCLVGPYRPFGLVRLGPDVRRHDSTTGYKRGEPVERFSHTHVSGTGGAGRYGNIGLLPFTGETVTRALPPYLIPPINQLRGNIPSNETSDVGMYTAHLVASDIFVRLTTTARTGVHEYTWKKEGRRALLIEGGCAIFPNYIAPGHLSTRTDWDSAATSVGGYIEVLSETELTGRSDIRGGWGHDKPYSLFFYISLSEPLQTVELCSQGGVVPGKVSNVVAGTECRAVLSFGNINTLVVKVGISFVSVAKARASVKNETQNESREKTFDEIVWESKEEWNKVFGKFQLSTSNTELKKLFYSCLYRLYCMPTDLGVDDENPHWHSGVRQFTDYYCLWDSIRNANSFFNLFDKKIAVDMANSLLDIADHTGWLPDAHIAGYPAFMQSACAADILYTEMYLKKIDGVDYKKALCYTQKNGEALPPDPLVQGRLLAEYNEIGYLSNNASWHPVSKHIEYTYHDWCIAELASHLGEKDTAEKFFKQADRVWNLWNPSLRSFSSRNADGTFPSNYNPWTMTEPDCYEGTVTVWGLNVLQDIPGLIEKHGGNEAFVAHLDKVFEEGLFEVKETRMHIPHLYTWAGRPDKTADRVRDSLKTFNSSSSGLRDNEDMGAQSSYLLWNAIGLYPLYGQDLYTLVPPMFDNISIEIEKGAILEITCDLRLGTRYIAGVTCNGVELERAWIRHHEISCGAKIVFKLSDKPETWGQKNLPAHLSQRGGANDK